MQDNSQIKNIIPDAVSWTRAESGVDSEVYRVVRDDGEAVYLRIALDVPYGYECEAQILTLLGEQGVSVPQVLHVEDQGPMIGRSYMIESETKGMALWTPTGGDSPEMQFARSILFDAGKELARINSVTVKGFGYVRSVSPKGEVSGEFKDFPSYVAHELEQNLNASQDKKLISSSEAERTEAAILHFASVCTDTEAFLSHGDYDTSHIFSEGGKYQGVIDFGDVAGAHQLMDIAHFSIFSPEHVDDLIAGFESIKKLDKMWRKDLGYLRILESLRIAGYCVRAERKKADPKAFVDRIGDDVYDLLGQAIHRSLEEIL